MKPRYNELVARVPAKYMKGVSIQYYIEVRTPDDRVIRNGHDKLKVFGIGSELDANGWRSLFRQLVAGGHLVGDDEGYGTLKLTDRARPVLRGEVDFRMRQVVPSEKGKRKERRERQPGTSSGVSGADQPIVAALRSLRTKLAAEANVPPYVIFHDQTILDIAAKRPVSPAALAGVYGLGARKIARYGDAIIETVTGHKPHPMLNNKLSVTVNQTLALHLQGKSAADIAAERRLEASTIMGHFAEAIEAGLIEARAVIGLEEEEIDEILAAFEGLQTLDSGRLGPVHAALGGRFDYGTLKCLLAELT